MRRRFFRDASGASAVEFALISPALIVGIVGGFQLAWCLHCAATVRWALETNARNLMLQPSESASTLKSAMLNSINGIASARNLTVTITPDSSSGAPMLVATSVFQETLAVPFMQNHPLTFTSVTKVPSL
jgi:Flp pilus assembly protein TadG